VVGCAVWKDLVKANVGPFIVIPHFDQSQFPIEGISSFSGVFNEMKFNYPFEKIAYTYQFRFHKEHFACRNKANYPQVL